MTSSSNNYYYSCCKIFLTGHPNIGKTTLIQHIVKRFSKEEASLPSSQPLVSLQDHHDYDCDDHDKKSNPPRIYIKGFYTEEYRHNGTRQGFDIIYWPNPNDLSCTNRQILSRHMSSTFSKNDARVGNYKVNVQNVETFCVGSIINRDNLDTPKNDIISSNDDDNDNTLNELIIVDEVGKMEMKCESFIPNVNALLDYNPPPPPPCENKPTQKRKRLIVGTIPTPRYGRIIPAVEDIRAREDVLVVHVTKTNRDLLRNVLMDLVHNFFQSNKVISTQDIQTLIQPFIYMRPIGASSMSTTKTTSLSEGISTSNQQIELESSNFEDTVQTMNQPCGPLVESSNQSNSTTNTTSPRILLLGETASPLPTNSDYSYCERSMWMILGRIYGGNNKNNMYFTPIKDINLATQEQLDEYIQLKSIVLENGIAIWDVFSNVHEQRGKKSNSQRKRQKIVSPTSNDILTFCKNHPTLEKICFIGKKAHQAFVSHILSSHQEEYHDKMMKRLKLIVLPSSSPANSRVSMDEKVKFWNKSFSFPDNV